MKKLFTLLAATFCATAIFAQYDNHGYDQRHNDGYQTQEFRNGRDFNDSYRFDGRDNRKIQRQVERINREFDRKIDRVRDSWMRSYEKQRVIMDLEQQRRQEIREVYARFGGRGDWDRNHDGDRRGF
jgi:hypothetical protein